MRPNRIRACGKFASAILLGCVCLAAAIPAQSAEKTPAATAARKETKPPRTDNAPASSGLSASDLQAIRALLNSLGTLFLEGMPSRPKGLFGGKIGERERTFSSLENEFTQSVYLDFEILAVEPDLSLEHHRHTVDATLRYLFIKQDALTPALQTELKRIAALNPRALERRDLVRTLSSLQLDEHAPALARALKPHAAFNTSTYAFFVQKDTQGGFLLLNSSFFDTLGLRRGTWQIVGNILLATIAGVALLAFWIWMIWAAFRIQPRRTIWRVLVMVPVAGAMLFFFIHYIPGLFKPRSAAST